MNSFFPIVCLVSIPSVKLIYGLSIPQFTHVKVPIVDRSHFDPNKHYFHTHSNGNHFETPVLIKNALAKQQCEFTCDRIVQELGDENVTLQRKIHGLHKKGEDLSETDIADVTLLQALDYMMESEHGNSCFCFCEGLMDGHDKLKYVQKILRDTKESLFGAIIGDDNRSVDDKKDLFESFPEDFRPSDCVVIAGEGATSTLHRDPYTWTGTSLCLEGTKLWRFVAPPGAVSERTHKSNDSDVGIIDDAVKSYRLPSVAWENDSFLSCGWQSDMSLFRHRSEGIRCAESFASLEETNPLQKYDEMVRLAMDVEKLSPSCDFPSEMSNHEATTLYAVVQEPGDLLIIPAYWWHQTYALEPSVAVASQRGGVERDAKRIVTHVFDTLGLPIHVDELPCTLKDVMNDSYTGPTKNISIALFEYLGRL